MEDLVGEIGKSFVRGIGYLLAEIFFGTICYWVGWPICKTVTLGKYPSSTQIIYLEDYRGANPGFWCSAVGLVTIIIVGVYLMT